MKKALKITNWVFIIGLVLIVLVFIVAKVQAYQLQLNPPEIAPLPESFRSPETDFLLSLFLWCVAYAFARMILYTKS